MKIRNILDTFEKANEAIKYVVFILSLYIMGSLGFCAFYMSKSGDTSGVVMSIVFDIMYVLLVLGLSISASGAVSKFKTYLMMIFASFNSFGLFIYSFMSHWMYYQTNNPMIELGGTVHIMVIVAFVCSIILVLSLLLRFFIISQYDVCTRNSLIELNKKNLKASYIETLNQNQNRFLTLMDYYLGYIGFWMLLNAFSNITQSSNANISVLIFGIILFIATIIFFVVQRKVDFRNYKYVAFAAFFGLIAFISTMFLILSIVKTSHFGIFFYYSIITMVASYIGLAVALQYQILYLIGKKKASNF